MKPRIAIEAEFDQFVRGIGGVVLRDTLEKSPSFSNADYYFPKENVVAELKCLEENKLADPGIQDRFRRLWIKWRQRGDVSGAVPDSYQSKDLPTQCQKEMYSVYGVPVKRRIAKANRQIRETKAHLKKATARGLLLIANDGNLALEPPALIHILFTALRNDFSAIDCFIFFTANYFVKVAGVDKQSLLWIAGVLSEERMIEESFTNALYSGWSDHVEKIQGVPIEKIELPGLECFADMKFSRGRR